ncbi:MAG: Asp-tRNA(Asn)/Glu-tRNA(Gln) amidotransferase subunit GatA [Albidovulum sp.]|nr:Asp-tRNA(Asn)/Glu-tRNA(Gln) amidotransferase subunit GatA [Albidovulum sp.]MDE0305637.1 Asp-tRNA(Asn)/Glu-tRNA(Gln) amidotransferase subunit GatA [Albidovulum sp.]MDE0533641.1 Asp-tRNA(Asn)/Glu-tRNA(Gln) amidotransferase subunit GatA [Albidovulum sp.]
MRELNQLSISEARDGLRSREFSAVELANSCLAAVDNAAELNLFCETTAELALDAARMADVRISSGDAPSMCGIPVGIKDLFCTAGVSTQAASKILQGFKPEYESTVTARLTDAGATMLGKLNMDEFAMGSSTEHSVYGPAVNPWRAKGCDRKRSPGGSSGGSAAAVAADLCLGALGTDTGGSIRQPAAFTGTVGVKPTYGRCSRWGIIAFASSLDQAGPLTKSVRDAAIMLEAISGHDPKDSTSANHEVPNFESFLERGVAGKKIGIPREFRLDAMPSEIETLWSDGAKMLRSQGAEIVDVSLPHTKYALPAYYVIAPAEASSNLARYDGVRYGYRARLRDGEGIVELYKRTRAEGFGQEVKRRVMIGTYVLSQGFYEAYYRRAQKVRSLIKRDFEKIFAEGVEALLTPATPSSAFEIGSVGKSDPVEMYLNDVFTVTVNLAGLPGISVPAGLDRQGLPLGLQIIGRPWDEGEMLACAYAIEDAAGFSAKPDRWWI